MGCNNPRFLARMKPANLQSALYPLADRPLGHGVVLLALAAKKRLFLANLCLLKQGACGS